MTSRIYADRQDAGRQLAAEVARHALTDPIVLALPRGGVPVAHEVARALHAPLDVMVVRKLGAPLQPELAIGAIASGGIRVVNDELVRRMDDEVLESIAARESEELARREKLYRGEREYPDLQGRDVVLVDDGMATGATMRAATQAVRSKNPAKIVVAVPTASRQAARLVGEAADELICLDIPEPFIAVGNFFQVFTQTSDEEVRRLLADVSEQRTVA